jgi:hypothetical protein
MTTFPAVQYCKSQNEIAGCEGKFRFPTYLAAENVLRQMRRRPPRRYNIAYRCHFYGGWHLTKPSTRLKWRGRDNSTNCKNDHQY